jgi:DNA-binding CsgD family transcriptional regulator
MAVTTAYEMGDWDTALRLADHTADVGMPSGAAANIDAAAGQVLAARGVAGVAELIDGSRPWWTEDGRIAVQCGAAALDVVGRDGDVDAMLVLHADVVGFLRDLWGHGHVAAEVRLAAIVMGHLATALRSGHGVRRTELLAHAERLATEADAVFGPGSPLHPPTLEGRAWLARAGAELERARWAARVDVPLADLVARWREVVAMFEEHGEPYEVARTQWRLGEVLLAAGDPAAAEVLGVARETAHSLGAVPLGEALRRLGPRPSRANEVLTAREAEVLGLLAEGRSNGEIGRALFISTKTASVHVSNILAKLGAASRGEAVALARSSGLLEH